MRLNHYDRFHTDMTKDELCSWLEKLPAKLIKAVAAKLAIPPMRSACYSIEVIEDRFDREEIKSAIKSEIFENLRRHYKFSRPLRKKNVLDYLSLLETKELETVVLFLKDQGVHLVHGLERQHHLIEIKSAECDYKDIYRAYKKLELLPGIDHQKTKSRAKTTTPQRVRELSPALLNTSVALPQLIADVENFYKYLAREKTPLFHNYNLIFHGPPGTGKSMFAQTLASKLKRPLISLSASDLLSHLVGETEEFIVAAFQEAQKKKAILFLDEMDAILGEREAASASWERSQVNEFLIQMEKFQGVFIAATNFPKIVDKALERRFAHKIFFSHLKEDAREAFFDFFFKLPLTQMEKVRLSRMHSLAPGDFKVALQRGFFHPTQTATLYLDELERINDSKKRRPIGFHAA